MTTLAADRIAACLYRPTCASGPKIVWNGPGEKSGSNERVECNRPHDRHRLVKRNGDIYVANCSGNFIAKVASDGTATPFAKSDLFKCPNGISIDPRGNLYTVNVRDNQMLKIDPKGAVTAFAKVSQQGLGHLCFRDDRFFVTAFAAHEIYEVKLDGTARRILGNGEPGIVDGVGDQARLSFPNGIACNPWGCRLHINEFIGDETTSLARRAIVREIIIGTDE